MAEYTRKKPKFRYEEDAMNAAIDAVHAGMSFKKAANTFGVPRSTLIYKVKGYSPKVRKMGPSTVLTDKEEKSIVNWLNQIARAGFPLKREDLLDVVQNIIVDSGRKNPFTNNRPGKKWFDSFLRRHPEITKRVPEQLTSTRASVTEFQIRLWFSEVLAYMKEENIDSVLKNPDRIFNIDESCFSLCPKTGKVLGPKGERNLYSIVLGSEKESITVAITICADGSILPPFIVYPYIRLPSDIAQHVPKHWAIGKTESGWMTGESFYEYITNVFHPWILKKNVPLPVIMFMDGHKSHLTIHISEFCSANGIILVALFPNSTHITQPCDVSIFKPMKQKWKTVVHQWRIENSHAAITKQNFALLFKDVVNSVTPSCIINGFRTCGISPFDPNAVDFTKCRNNLNKEGCEPAKSRTSLKFINQVESFIDRDLLIRFSETYANNKEWDGEITAHDLFILWRKIKKSANAYCVPNQKIGNSSQQSDNVALNSDPTLTVEPDEQHIAKMNIEESDELNKLKEPLASSSASSEHIAMMNIEDSSNSSVGSPFKRALFWPETKLKKVKKQTEYGKVPCVATSEEWKKHFKIKKEEKEKKEREKEERKRVREAKKQEKLTLASEKKVKKKSKAKTKSKDTDSESEDSTEVIFNDSSDSDSSVGDQNEHAENTTKNINLMTENYYAVYYEEKYYIGRITSLFEKKSNVKFLKEIMENSFTWPKKTDEECVRNGYIFFGPLTMVGNDPFFLSVGDIRKIKSAYRQLKHKLKEEST